MHRLIKKSDGTEIKVPMGSSLDVVRKIFELNGVETEIKTESEAFEVKIMCEVVYKVKANSQEEAEDAAFSYLQDEIEGWGVDGVMDIDFETIPSPLSVDGSDDACFDVIIED